MPCPVHAVACVQPVHTAVSDAGRLTGDGAAYGGGGGGVAPWPPPAVESQPAVHRQHGSAGKGDSGAEHTCGLTGVVCGDDDGVRARADAAAQQLVYSSRAWNAAAAGDAVQGPCATAARRSADGASKGGANMSSSTSDLTGASGEGGAAAAADLGPQQDGGRAGSGCCDAAGKGAADSEEPHNNNNNNSGSSSNNHKNSSSSSSNNNHNSRVDWVALMAQLQGGSFLVGSGGGEGAGTGGKHSPGRARLHDGGSGGGQQRCSRAARMGPRVSGAMHTAQGLGPLIGTDDGRAVGGGAWGPCREGPASMTPTEGPVPPTSFLPPSLQLAAPGLCGPPQHPAEHASAPEQQPQLLEHANRQTPLPLPLQPQQQDAWPAAPQGHQGEQCSSPNAAAAGGEQGDGTGPFDKPGHATGNAATSAARPHRRYRRPTGYRPHPTPSNPPPDSTTAAGSPGHITTLVPPPSLASPVIGLGMHEPAQKPVGGRKVAGGSATEECKVTVGDGRRGEGAAKRSGVGGLILAPGLATPQQFVDSVAAAVRHKGRAVPGWVKVGCAHV